MSVDAVDVFYLSMPVVRDIGDGSQDVLLVRVRAGDFVGWGECEASPLTSIASLVCPMSHSACKPVLDSVIGQPLNDVAEIARICDLVRRQSLDLLQARHTLSGIEIAMWDLLGRRFSVPVHELLGWPSSYPKTPYASVLFGDTPEATLEKARAIAGRGFRAAKFGWGPYGTGSVSADAMQVRAAREGLGADRLLFVDAGTVWGSDVEAAALRLPALEECDVRWLEEPFGSGAFSAYRELASRTSCSLRLAAGEAAHDADMARHLIDYAGIGYVQVDVGRIGGIAPAVEVASYAGERGVQFVNHTFTTHLALAASLHSFAGLREASLCEYPAEPSELAYALTSEHLVPDADGLLRLPGGPGLGVRPSPAAVAPYLLDVEIKVGGSVLYRTPKLEAE